MFESNVCCGKVAGAFAIRISNSTVAATAPLTGPPNQVNEFIRKGVPAVRANSRAEYQSW